MRSKNGRIKRWKFYKNTLDIERYLFYTKNSGAYSVHFFTRHIWCILFMEKLYKYQEISAYLLRAIELGEYRERLPSVRLLEDMLGVNKRTVLRALQELTAKGVIVQNGNQGFFINRQEKRRPVTGNIVIYSQERQSQDILSRPVPNLLNKLITASGKRVITMSSVSSEICSMRNFWESLSADGVIFLHSTLTQDAACQLKISGIPFVASNRMPREWGVNYVDFAHEDGLNLVLTHFLKRRHRRVAMLTPAFPLSYFRDIFYSTYEKTLNSYAVFDPELFCSQECSSQAPDEFFKLALHRLMKLPLPPTALYSSLNISPGKMQLLMDELKDELPENFELFCYYGSGIQNDPPTFPGLDFSYDELVRSLWELLEGVIKAPDASPEGILIPLKLRKQ